MENTRGTWVYEFGFFLNGSKFKYKKPPLGTGFSISNKLNFFEKNTKFCFSIGFTTFGIFGIRKIFKKKFRVENGRNPIDF